MYNTHLYCKYFTAAAKMNLTTTTTRIIIMERIWFIWHKLKAARPHYKCHDVSSLTYLLKYLLTYSNHAIMCSCSYFRKVLSSRLKAGRVVDEITSVGRAFQTRAAMTGKARSPTLDSHDVGMAKVSEDHDRNHCLDGMSLTLCSSVDKCAGDLLLLLLHPFISQFPGQLAPRFDWMHREILAFTAAAHKNVRMNTEKAINIW